MAVNRVMRIGMHSVTRRSGWSSSSLLALSLTAPTPHSALCVVGHEYAVVLEAWHSCIAKRLECAELALHLIRICGIAEAPWARSVNPVRGGLFIVRGPQNVSQTPLGVACESSPLLCHRERADRPPLTGFGNIIGCSGYYKQATPSGVLRRHARESKNACKAQELAPAFDRAITLKSGSKLRAVQTLRDQPHLPRVMIRDRTFDLVRLGAPARCVSLHATSPRYNLPSPNLRPGEFSYSA
jgi:hypothetical protein